MDIGVLVFIYIMDAWFKFGAVESVYEFDTFKLHLRKNIKSRNDLGYFLIYWLLPFTSIGLLLMDRIIKIYNWWAQSSTSLKN